jgi:ankyrin repeat protein
MRANAGPIGVWSVILLLSAARLDGQSSRPLIDAVKNQDAAAVRALLKRQIDINAVEPDGATALHWAAHRDDVDSASLLTRAGAKVNVANAHGVTPLSLACLNGSAAMVERLLEAGADPNLARVSGETPLMTAARVGALPVVDALLARGADINSRELAQEQTALMWAVSEKHAAVAKRLIAHGADVRARSKGGFSPILFAARAGDLESARALVAAGADVNDAAPDGMSVLLVAVVRGHSQLAIELLDRGANPNADGAGFTALHWASGSWETELTGPNGIVTEADDEWSALRGIQTGKLALIQALLARRADPNAVLAKIPPRVGYTQLAVEQRVIGVNPHAGATPFLLAAMAGDVSVMRALAAGGADPRRTATDKTTPLMVAAGLGRYLAESRVTDAQALEAARLAIELGGDVNAANDAGNTALHGAAYIKSNALVQLLVDKGAIIDVANKRGQTPTTIADTIRAGSATMSSRTSTGDLLRKLAAR